MSNTRNTVPTRFIGPLNWRNVSQWDVEDLPRQGWLTFLGQGEENTYYATTAGALGFVKT